MAFLNTLREFISSGLRLAKGVGEWLLGHEEQSLLMTVTTTSVAVCNHWSRVRVARPEWKLSERRS